MFSSAPTLSLEMLTTMIEHHLFNFAYQNHQLYSAGKFPLHERKIPSLDVQKNEELMLKNKGGYCFQHLELMYSKLTQIGFKVERHLAKPIVKTYDKFPSDLSNKPKTHELLIVNVDDRRYIVDVGMAQFSMRAPLPLIEGEQFVGGDYYRLKKENDCWALDTRSRQSDDWTCLFLFFDSPDNADDIVRAHENLYTSSEHMPIRDEIQLVGKVTMDRREHVLVTASNFGMFRSIKSNTNAQPLEMKFDSDIAAIEFARQQFGLELK